LSDGRKSVKWKIIDFGWETVFNVSAVIEKGSKEMAD
jgi:hypothetical protein